MADTFSWNDDSSPEDQFVDDDDDSWMSEQSTCNNWRGWKKTTTNTTNTTTTNQQQSNFGAGPSSSNSNAPGHYPHTHGGNGGNNHPIHHASTSSSHYYGGNNGGSRSTTSSTEPSGGTSTATTARQQAIRSSSSNNQRGVNLTSELSSTYGDGAGSSTLSPSTLNGLEGGQGVTSATSSSNPNNHSAVMNVLFRESPERVPSLTEMAARAVAYHISFEVVERVCSPIPEQLQLRIAYWSFPDNEEDIRLYSCLANGSADEFQKGETLYRARAVHNTLQIGFHLSATVISSTKVYTVAVTFDRCRITSCNCTCPSRSSWCSHVVAVCLYRIYEPYNVRLRAPVSESLTQLSRDQLQKFAQYLISESPKQILPTAQRLLDDLLLNENSHINMVRGAPDPTAGAPASEQSRWCLDELQLHDSIRKIVIKLCVPSPVVYSDVNYLSSAAPPAAAEWSSLLRPLRGREPEGLWNLFSIVREMLRRHDRNAVPLLRILTEELLSSETVVIWWFNNNVSLHRGYPPNSSYGSNSSNGGGSNNRSMHSNIYASQHTCCSLCDEIVVLWRLVTLNPANSSSDTQMLYNQLKEYHLKTLSMIHQFRPGNTIVFNHQNGANGNSNSFRPSMSVSPALVSNGKQSDMEIFSGFKPAMVSCLVDWDAYPIPGVTHQKRNNQLLYEPSVHDQLNLVNHAIHSTVISLDPDVLWKPGGLHHQLYHNTQSDQFSDTNSSGEKRKKSSPRRSLEEDEFSSIQARKDNESDDSGNQEFWERFSVTSSEDQQPAASAERRNSSNADDDDLPAASAAAGPSSSGTNGANADNNQNRNDVNEDYQIYIINSDLDKVKNVNNRNNENSLSDSQWEPVLLAATMVKPIEDPFEILFARAEALYAHGYVDEACRLSVKLAQELLSNPPDLQLDLNSIESGLSSPPQPSTSNSIPSTSTGRGSHTKRMNRNRFNPALHQVSLLTSATLSKAAFLCQVLSENEDSHLLAFHVGLFGLELVRPPASTKALEVKLAHQEQELVNLLKRIPLCPKALQVLREKAEQLRDSQLTTRGYALLPLSLASYIFEAFQNLIDSKHRLATDEQLVFDAVVAAIGLKAKISEAEHPLLCEGTRRQRGDLALNLLVHYRDNKARLDAIIEKLLDQEINPIFNSNKKSTPSYMPGMGGPKDPAHPILIQSAPHCPKPAPTVEQPVVGKEVSEPLPSTSSADLPPSTSATAEPNVWSMVEEFQSTLCMSNGNTTENGTAKAGSSSATKNKSMDSSAADTTSSDNSPTVSRRVMFHKNGKKDSGSESSSSGGESSSSSSTDSLSSDPKKPVTGNETSENTGTGNGGSTNQSNSASALTEQFSQSSTKQRQMYVGQTATGATAGPSSSTAANRYMANISPGSPSTSGMIGSYPTPSTSRASSVYQSTGVGNVNAINNGTNNCFKRYKGKRHYPVIPNQPSEASAHFMFELGKTLLAKAGGNNTTVLFTQPPSSQNCRAPHRLLHMCSFQIGLYALGLHNAVSPNWLSRTYSSYVSWITCQAMEIGHQAIEFLIDTWEGHLTPPEVVSLADRASRSQEVLMVKAAAELALSCLPHAHALTPNEIQRALIQCKEQSTGMLERACLAVEQAAQGGGVYPEVLFDVARKWYELYEAEKFNEIQEQQQSGSGNNNASGSGGSDETSGAVPDAQEQRNQDAAIQAIQQEYFDQQQQQLGVDNPTLGDSSFFQPPVLLGPPAAMPAPFQPELAPYMYLPTSTQIPLACQSARMNFQRPSKSITNFYRPFIFDQRGGYYPNANQPPPVYGGSPFNPTSNAVLRAAANYQAQFYPPPPAGPAPPNNMLPGGTGSNMFPANGSYYYPLTNSNQPPTMPQIMAAATAPPGTTPYSFMAPMSMVRAQFGFIPQGLVAGQATFTPAGQKFQFISMKELAHQLSGGKPSHHGQMPNTTQSILGPRQLHYMHAAYRVGMLAMDTLSRRVHDDRPQAKYARNPSYGEDVKWLLCIAKKLGSQYVQEFCICTLTAVASPFVLYEIILEAAQSIFQGGPSNSAYVQSIRSQILTPLIQKCQSMFTSCIYFQILHIASSDYEEFIQTLRTARAAYQLMPGGSIPFNDLLQSLKRTKSCKKELWQMITTAMQSA